MVVIVDDIVIYIYIYIMIVCIFIYGISNRYSPTLSWLMKYIPPLVLCRKQGIISNVEI